MSINKVAKLAGVSNSTVSRVINNHPRVAPETEKAVRQAMRELGYIPSDRRPGPKPANRTRTATRSIAFLVLGTSRRTATPGFGELLHGVSLGASQSGMNLNFTHVPDPEQLPARFTGEGIDGLLLHGALPSPAVVERLRRLPTVWLMGNRRRPDWGDQVMPDAYDIGVQAANYLLGRGHRRLVYLNLAPEHWTLRMYGQSFATTGQDAGATVTVLEEPRELTPDYWQPHSPQAVARLVDRYLKLDPQPTGIFVADDMQVAMLQPALQQRGVQVAPAPGSGTGSATAPGKADIIASNNEEPYLIGLHPKPAVIDIRIEAIGRRGVEQLLWRMDHPDVPERITSTIEPFVIPAGSHAGHSHTSSHPEVTGDPIGVV